MELKTKSFSKEILNLENIELVCDEICQKLRLDIKTKLKRRGAVVGISGGIDSSVVLALATRALGKENVIGILLPERDSSPDSLMLAQKLAHKFGVRTFVEDITPVLEGFGCYKRRDEAVANVFSEFNPIEDKAKIEIKQTIAQNIPNVFSLTIVKSNGFHISTLLPSKEYLQIVAATNFKQRSRMSMLYYYAESLHYSVVGTPNKHEVEQGFFVKYGDGGADVMPIGHLYKTQVYQLAEYLGVPQQIIERTPTTDTYSAEQTQEEFFYQMPFHEMDLLWYAWENDYKAEEVALVLNKESKEIQNIFKNFERKQKTTEYLRLPPIF
ncbi:NAD(+) synthase [Ancylomarina euxinus]|uniref:NH(3)-dependent NAD(+) synthetase n=1 Tax=Ancylomarina euxinus TaxID=2283627 RepID=A0A425Y6M7_9BACT|nr:NAD(+) synthase [Ancylomarina euxinus]MCZ4694023.1 NAD(+) synthase [Ancylomarina euxinus]MUP14557.1 NAD(+) synthase [Ancylomarina euxinus]RRG24106.1 NAD(+) synthase [Ancylomarina euxinus]